MRGWLPVCCRMSISSTARDVTASAHASTASGSPRNVQSARLWSASMERSRTLTGNFFRTSSSSCRKPGSRPSLKFGTHCRIFMPPRPYRRRSSGAAGGGWYNTGSGRRSRRGARCAPAGPAEAGASTRLGRRDLVGVLQRPARPRRGDRRRGGDPRPVEGTHARGGDETRGVLRVFARQSSAPALVRSDEHPGLTPTAAQPRGSILLLEIRARVWHDGPFAAAVPVLGNDREETMLKGLSRRQAPRVLILLVLCGLAAAAVGGSASAAGPAPIPIPAPVPASFARACADPPPGELACFALHRTTGVLHDDPRRRGRGCDGRRVRPVRSRLRVQAADDSRFG